MFVQYAHLRAPPEYSILPGSDKKSPGGIFREMFVFFLQLIFLDTN